MIQSIDNNAKKPGVAVCPRLIGAAALAIVLALASLTPGAASADEKKKQEISRTIAKEMTAAQKAMQAQQWQDAIKNLEAAETKSGLTPFDEEKIHYFKGFAYVKLNNLKSAQVEFEKASATNAAPPEDSAQISKILFQLAASTQQYQKAIDYGKQLVDSGAATNDTLTIIAQSYYLLKDCKDTVVWADKGIAAARKAGDAPKENLFLFKLQCASDSQDNTAMDPVLIDLIKLSNKTSYWNSLLRIERQDERDDHNTLMIYRIMYDTQAMKEDTDYIEMAQLLGDAALPGEAATVLNKAMSSGIVKDEHKERTQRLLNSLQSRADADKKGLTQLAAEAAKNPAGELSVKLGEVYYGVGDYQQAIDAINQGLQKGQVKHLDEAYVYLGLSQVQLKNNAEAKKAFGQLKTVPNISPRVLKLWELFAGEVGVPLVPAA
jgi:tetratricopeptide (TPR) repeat protein